MLEGPGASPFCLTPCYGVARRADLRDLNGSYGMIRVLSGILLSAFVLATTAGSNEAQAHPHVWVTVKSELVYGPDGAVTAVRHHWTFDEMFSTFATQGLDTDKDGKLSRDELKGLAEVNVT